MKTLLRNSVYPASLRISYVDVRAPAQCAAPVQSHSAQINVNKDFCFLLNTETYTVLSYFEVISDAG